MELDLDQAEQQKVAAAPPAKPATGNSLDEIANDPVRAKAELDKAWKATWYERIYGPIYGTQLRALVALKAAGPEGIKSEELQVYYTQHQQLANTAGSVADAFWQYLMNAGLMEAFPTADGPKCRLTETGYGFLEYVGRIFGSHAILKPM